MSNKYIFKRTDYLKKEKEVKDKEEKRLKEFIRDHIKKHGGSYREYCVGIVISKERYDERMIEHEVDYEIIEKSKDKISSKYSDVIRNVEGYFSDEAEHKNSEEWTYGGPGGPDLEYTFLYVFKFSKLLKKK